jgi:hypothetical protein
MIASDPAEQGEPGDGANQAAQEQHAKRGDHRMTFKTLGLKRLEFDQQRIGELNPRFARQLMLLTGFFELAGG